MNHCWFRQSNVIQKRKNPIKHSIAWKKSTTNGRRRWWRGGVKQEWEKFRVATERLDDEVGERVAWWPFRVKSWIWLEWFGSCPRSRISHIELIAIAFYLLSSQTSYETNITPSLLRTYIEKHVRGALRTSMPMIFIHVSECVFFLWMCVSVFFFFCFHRGYKRRTY